MNKLRRKSVNSNRRSSGRSIVSDSELPDKDKDSRRSSGVARPPSDIPSIKWREILDDAEEDIIVNSIREELISRAMDALYTRYLEKESYAFVVHCSYLAWMRLFNWMYLKRDPGESVQTVGENWSCDEAPNPVPVDPWACGRMTVCKAQSSPPETKPCSVPCSSTVDVYPPISVPAFTGSSYETSTEKLTCENRDPEPDAIADSERLLSSLGGETSSASLSQGQRSIFTRTISMAKANLPVTSWKSQRGSKNETTNYKNRGKRNKMPVAMQPPERLDLAKLPPDRTLFTAMSQAEQKKKHRPKKKKRRRKKQHQQFITPLRSPRKPLRDFTR